jgi:hypothetical protein
MNLTGEDELEDLKPKDKEALRLIVDWIAKDPLHQAPTFRELLDELNKVLPRQQPGNRPALVGTEQIHRIAERLRRLKLLVDIPLEGRRKGRDRNLVPTTKGARLVRQWQSEATRK